MEHFYTLQGEGLYTGQAAYFIRVAGCDVGCVWCDVKDSWDAKGFPLMTSEQIVTEALKHPSRIAVVTGGEPTMYDLKPLTNALKINGFRTHIETSAAHLISGNWDWITLSPKKFKPPLEENLLLADELKIIIFNTSDFDWAESYAALVRPNCKLLLQVEWSKRETLTKSIIDYVKNNPRWQISIQTHKYLNIP